ncbi:AAA family ATPase [Cohnella xylanilytica]|uniref:AAA family ATPase n=1 Tax=Cohnella xylanilytica TaxID=557555 RepID=A0A841U2C3_9BACL|nr:AAA family ATPase [Cohnella xylanilytica]MBB6694686.1 AAA family ATPase [Cohnella xylanilytica]
MNAHSPTGTLRKYIDRHAPLGAEAFLELARTIAARVETLHRSQLLHLDLRPERIAVPGAVGDADLLDSGLAVRHTADGNARPAGLSLSPEGMPYCAPENTGRMQRCVDERSDLYSLGVIFYEMLTGRLPFAADNPLEWVYKHLTQPPEPMTGRAAKLPEGYEAVVLKLLEKNPDRRYSNAGLLIADLDKIGSSPEAVIAEPGIQGRDRELAVLTQAFYSACFGSTEMIYVSGEAGIGKTSLIEEMFLRQRPSSPFYFIAGKFEQIPRESPYYPILQAFRGLMRHLLSLRKEEAESWGAKLRENLGASASVIADLVPEAGLLMGGVSPSEELQAGEAKKRFLYAFRKFVQALASREQPLVLFIDDLQWADASSLELLHSLLGDPECQYLLLVCAFRPAETDRGRLPGYEADGFIAGQAVVREIRLSPLELEALSRIAAETLNGTHENTLALTELLLSPSGGNPFHFKQLLLRLQEDRILRYDSGLRRWRWDEGQLIGLGPEYALSELIGHRLRRLPEEIRELLPLAACVGSVFDIRLIASAAGREGDDLGAAWSEAENAGLLVPFGPDKFRFAHDNVQKFLYAQLDDQVKGDSHARIGRLMIGREAEYGASAFDAINQLNRGIRNPADREELLWLARLNLDAGNRAKSSSAYDVALGYYAKGAEWLPEEEWDREFDLVFELRAQQAECLFLCGSHEASGEAVDILLGRARNAVERSRARLIRIMQHINQGKYLEGTALGLASLREHRIFIAEEPAPVALKLEALRTELILRDRHDRIARMEEMSDADRIAAMNLIFAIVPSTFFTNKKVFFLLTCKAVQLSLKYGNTAVSAAVYSAYGMFLGTGSADYERGFALAKAGVELAERYDIASVKTKVYTVFGAVLCQFAGDAREGDGYLQQALRFGLESGDYVFASYALGGYVNSLYTRASLSELSRAIADSMAALDTTNDEFVRQNFYLYQRLILALRERTDAPDSFDGPGFSEAEFLRRIGKEETAATTNYQYHAYKTQLCYLSGWYEDAIGWAKQAEAYEAYATHLPHLPYCIFYETLAMLAVHDADRPGKDAADKQRLKRHLGRYRRWAASGPANFEARLRLLEAEHARVLGQERTAEELYDRALREARERDDLHAAALAGELAADYYEKRGRQAAAAHYLRLAIEGFERWGLEARAARLAVRLQNLLRPEQAAAGSAEESRAEQETAAGWEDGGPGGERGTFELWENIDLAAILRTTRAMNDRMDLDSVLAEILGTILRYAGANKGALITGNDRDVYWVQAYAASESPIATSPRELNESSPLPDGLIRYVFRTQEDVRYSGGEESWLIHNPYIARERPQSALCIPVSVHGAMLGVLYLENKLAAGVFPPDRTAVLRAMASNGIFMCVLQNAPEPTSSLEPGHETEEPPGQPAASSSAPRALDEPLTDRELEVLSLLAKGLSNKEIAERLIISSGTVKVHVRNIFAKLKVNRRINAIAQATELKLLE